MHAHSPAWSAFRRSPSADAPLAGRLVFVVIALVLSVAEVWLGRLSPDFGLLLVRILASAIALALCGWFPARAGCVFAVVTALGLALPPADAQLSVLLIGAYLIAADWISRRWYVEAALLVLVVETSQLIVSPLPGADLIGLALGVGLAVPAGLGLQRLRARFSTLNAQVAAARRDARRARQAAADAEDRVRRDIAVDLHDTVAHDLTAVVLISEALTAADAPKALKPRLAALARSARDAAAHVRQLMPTTAAGAEGLRPASEAEDLQGTLATCANMLAAREIHLDVEVEAPGVPGGGATWSALLCGILREGSVNTLKYAPVGSVAHVRIHEEEDGRTSLTMTNEIAEPSATARPELSGGLGLAGVARRIEAAGGTIRYGAANGMWVLTADLPELATPAPAFPTARIPAEVLS